MIMIFNLNYKENIFSEVWVYYFKYLIMCLPDFVMIMWKFLQDNIFFPFIFMFIFIIVFVIQIVFNNIIYNISRNIFIIQQDISGNGNRLPLIYLKLHISLFNFSWASSFCFSVKLFRAALGKISLKFAIKCTTFTYLIRM